MAQIGLYNCRKSKCNDFRSTIFLFRFIPELCLLITSLKNRSSYTGFLTYTRSIKLILIVLFSFFALASKAQTSNLLYFVSDDSNELYTIDRYTGTVTLIGSTGRSNIEAIAYYPIPGSETLYAADAGDFGTLNRTTGAFTLIGEIDGGGTADGSAGAQTLNDVDGLMLDGQSLIMWAIERKSGSTPDLLFQINLSTGQFVADAFGSGVDYLEIVGEGIDVDVDDLAVDPVSGEIYGVSNNNGADDVLIKVNKTTGEFELVAALAEDDVEGLAFHNDGKLYGSEGDAENRLILINKSTGAVSNYLSLSPGGDVEALAALVAPSNFIEGNVFEDDDLDGIKDPGETGIANVTVYLYLDQNGDGQVDPEDTRIQSTTTDSNGDYSFFYITTGTLITKTETASHPSGYSLTTDNFETMTFTDGVNFGETDSDNDFGLGTGSDCDGDGITDFFEGELDSDGDGIQNKCDLDSDNDGLRDDVEGSEDYDDDGIPNYLDRDSDDDGIPDAIEANGGIRPTEYVASQGNLSGTDSDGNGIIDSRETFAGSGVMIAPNPDSDGDGYIDILDLDSDNDGILDLREAGATVDSDNDGQVDNITDANGNGYADVLETSPLAIPNTDLFYENSNGLTKRPNYIDIDSDADGIDDTREGQSTIGYRTITLFGDNDEDGILDFWDISNGKYPITPVDTDTDGSPDYVDTNSDNDPESDFIEGNDADNNGVADETNTGLDANGNGLDDRFDSGCSGVACSSDVSLPDTDNDNEYDFRDFEGAPIDTDGDGIPDATDIDDDNDGILDINESEVIDTDGDGIVNSLDLDSDGDGILDIIEAGGVDTDNDGRVDDDTDTDNDGWADTFDSDNGGTALTNADTDGDGIKNFLDLDSDGDGVVDLIESQASTGSPVVPSGTDSDGDGIDNAFDVTGGTPVDPVDTESDGTPDYLDYDSDNDGFPDLLEAWDTDGDYMAETIPTGGDSDVDGLDNAFDLVAGPNSTTNTYNNQDALDFPDETTSGFTSERDWREDNEVDSGGDGQINSIDIDDDDDGILDIDEGQGDFDNDGIINSLDLDSDNDGIPDIIEAGGVDTDDDGRVDDNTDTDNDGWADTFDSDNGGTALSNPDTDSDGLKNFLDIDSDGDGIVDLIESQITTVSPVIPSGTDTDLDGLDNAFDTDNGGTPTNPIDSDADTTPDYLDLNSDNDDFTDALEGWDTNGDLIAETTPSGSDTDGDGLDDAYDDVVGPNSTTNPTNDQTALAFPDVTTAGDSERDWRETNDEDADFDGIPDNTDIDDDNDGILDVDEGESTDTDGDGIVDRLDLDSDNDGIPDIVEAGGVDSNNDGRVDDDTDTDNDGWANTFDSNNGGTALDNPDTDDDGIYDYLDLDSDNDGIPDIIEAGGVDTNDDGLVDSATDTDEDGWANTFDSDNGGTALSNPDTDSDGLANNIDIDADGDGIVDLIESQATTGSPIIPVGSDTDGDGIDNAFDSDNGGTPITPVDTDSDSTPDYIDFNSDNDSFSDVLEGWDTDNDQVANTTPTGLDSDGDGLDNAFDLVVGPNATNNIYNDQDANDFPDVSTSGQTSERDWREENVLDADFDGIPDGIDIDDDNDGILDVDETNGCTEISVVNATSVGTGSYTVVEDGQLRISINGGDGGGGTSTAGGSGATITDAVFNVTAGDVIRYVVGEGSAGSVGNSAGGAGSTGLFINNTLVMVAGGGAGGDNSGGAIGLGANSGTAGDAGTGANAGAAGTAGNGGGGTSGSGGGGGGGINSVGGSSAGGGGSAADLTPANGVTLVSGGAASGTGSTAGGSGFTGGGGGADGDWSGGGGGYSGGGGAGDGGSAGGGGSFLATGDASYVSGSITAGADGAGGAVGADGADGFVTISFTCIGSDVDSDGDGIIDRLDLDSDNDGIPDIIEAGGVDNNNDGKVDNDTDTDGDGWADTFDSDNGGTALTDPDSDNDGVENRIDRDSDNDGILDVTELGRTDANGDGKIDSFIDSNGNGYNDTSEGGVLVIPNSDLSYENSNGLPNLPNYIDIDSDADGIDDTREGYSTLNYQFPNSFTDSDGDGILNFWDVDSGNSPIDPVDTDGAGLDDYVDTNSDNDSLSDFIEGNDFNEDGVADTDNLGVDANGNGLDDAFDQNCYGMSVSSIANSYGEEDNSDGTMYIDSSDLEFVYDGGVTGDQTVGLYFPNITIPQGSTINSAYIQFRVDETSSGVVNLTIEGQLATNALTFTTSNSNVSSRTRTSADVSWSPGNWGTIGDAGSAQRTVNIASVIQEIVNQGGWGSGNPLVIIISGPSDTDTRIAEVNPTLTINYGSGITACSSNVVLQDSDIDGEKDWRDSNGIDAPVDTDADGIPDIDDIDDDNDGILDADEGCVDTSVTGANASSATEIVSRVSNASRAVDGANGNYARFRDNGALMEVQLRGGSIVQAGTQITIRAQKTNGAEANTMIVTESSDGSNYVNEIEYSFATASVYENKTYTLTTDATHIRISFLRAGGDLRVDNVSYASFRIPCTGLDTDSDGISDHLDIDADGDGIVDLIESQATTGSPVVPLGIDTDGDGYDDAFDGDCTPCGAITGVPTVAVDTDGDLTPDFQDFNSDDDSFSDALEGWDTDGNLVANTLPSGTDSDGDGLDDAYDIVDGINSTTNVYNSQDAYDFPDETTGGNIERDWREENAADTDFDGIIDTNDIDDDNDGILDVDEGEVADADGDGIPNSLDLDSDNDGIPDIIEAGGIDLNKDGRVDDNTDTDDDGWADTFDSDNGGTALDIPDTDTDGIDDYLDLDSDNDGLFDIIEAGGVDADEDGVVDSATDTDSDGWANTFDSNNGGTALNNPDTDGDGIKNNLDIDSDGDGIVDLIESQATTGTPIVPGGSDTDGDGIDNAFDSDNGGTPVTPEDTDGDGTPDYLDFNSDGDSLTDIIEGWDTDGNLVANTLPSGNDTDGDGLDDNFDDVSGPNSTTNVYNNQDALDFPDVTTSGGTDRDWREASAIDTDSDGIADLDDIDDDNDGILDVDESCIDVSVGAGTATGVTEISADVANPANVIDGNLGTRADFNNEGATLQVELRNGSAVAAGTDITINGERRNNTTQMVVSESTDGVTFGNAVTYSFGARRSIEDINHTLATNATHIRIEAINYDDDIRIYEVDYPAFLLPCTGTDSDNDGIPNHLDLDSDNDGIFDIVEAGGVDTDNDGRVDNYTESGSNGWADTFDNIEGAGTPLTDPDNDTDDFQNRIDIDSDGDGINDLIESQVSTGTPVVPVGSDLDEDGIDDAFDVNCIPCGGVTGVPTDPVDTDADSTPDYLDVDSDNDGLNDIIEAWDTDGDYLPDTTPNGNDDDDDGLDDNFDDVVGPNSTTNVYNSQDAGDFPDVTTIDKTPERDWRETNEELCEPGGVDGNILFWVKADNGGTSWRDISNNFENVSAFGNVNNGSLINYNPTNYFDGTVYYNTTLSINANTYSDLAVIAVYEPAVNNAGSVWGEENGGFDRYILDASGATENNAVSNGTSNTSNVSGLYSTASTIMSTVIFDEDEGSGSSVYVNGDQVLTFTADHGGETSNTLQIGAKGNGTQRFKGLISEIIVYNQLLTSDTDLQQIHSYLALKYGITLSNSVNGDYIASDASTLFWDASDNIGFQNNVAGIARDDNTCFNQVQSKSSNPDAIVSIGLDDDNNGLEASNSLNTSTFDGDLSAAVWGHDGADLYDHDENIDFDILQVKSRLNREWRIRETGTVGTVTVSFDVSNLLGPSGVGTNDEAQIVMLVDADGDFSSGAQMVTQSFVVADDGFVNFQIDFADGTYFTLASGEQYALPITLLSFEALPKDDYIQLKWSTTTEEDNSYFRLEKLVNDMDFEPIGYVDGAGNSTQLNEYSFVDAEPSLGYNYYRLVDVDFGGNENTSEVIMVNFESKELVPKPYPNPVRVGESFSLDVPQNTSIENIQLVSMNGQSLRFEKVEEWNKLIISSSELRQGVYLFSFTINGQRYQSKLMVVN